MPGLSVPLATTLSIPTHTSTTTQCHAADELLETYCSLGLSEALTMRFNSPAQFGSPGALPKATTTHPAASVLVDPLMLSLRVVDCDANTSLK